MKSILVLLASLTLFACSQTPNLQPEDKPNYETYVAEGDSFKQLNFTSIAGDKINLNELPKRKLIVYFATWCHDSQRAMRQIMASPLAADNNLQIVGVGREENAANLEKFQQEYQLNFPLVSDIDRSYYNQVANAGIPRLILLDNNNNVVKTIIGEIPNTIDYLVW
ncbi:TlpA family protein disulfide reductase [Pseudoalteromonas tunicata]|uniref:TlpA family protein disulfide reductase n=1 Tax=Pseudoalteromonas tunicata TaxID=314281 RepID=UPI00273E1AD3|nr:TlpA disulfide reductase family protein [Pseudoalteromonas tunicata]MDP4985599.1 TlpA family protein disulfide reductase [Pseudoalteromonas tunicata]